MEREQRMRLFLRCLGALVGIGGMLVLAFAAGWPTCLAVVLMIYGNNLERKGEN